MLWNEMYLRDSAETFGNCVVAHGHRPGMELGRRLDHTRCYGVGCLADPLKLDYAKAKKSTHAWGGGMVWGEYCDSKAVLWLHMAAGAHGYRRRLGYDLRHRGLSG